MAPQMAPAYVCVACLMRSVTQAIFSFILHNVFCLYFVSHQLFRSYRLFFLFLFSRSKCEANVALLTEKKKTHFLTRANGAIVLSPWPRAIQTLLMSYAASNQSDKSCFCVRYQRARLQHFINMQPSGAHCSGSTAVPARPRMRDWKSFRWVLNNVTQIETLGPGGLRPPSFSSRMVTSNEKRRWSRPFNRPWVTVCRSTGEERRSEMHERVKASVTKREASVLLKKQKNTYKLY